MSRTKISEYSATANSNTDVGGINIDEGCAPSGINDAIRTLMAQLKNFQTGTGGDSFNGPVGTTTAAAGAFTTLSASGVATFSAGSAAAPALTTSGDTDTGVLFPAANTVAIATAGSERARIDSSGNLGLGVSPSSWDSVFKSFDIGSTGSVFAASSNINFGYNVYYNSGYKYKTTAGATFFRANASGFEWDIAASGTAGNAITFTQAMTLDASGNLGIGVSPSTWSQGKATEIGAVGNGVWAYSGVTRLMENVYFNSGYKYAAAGVAAAYMSLDNGTFNWNTTGTTTGSQGGTATFTQAMTLDASGNLGIGTTSPSYRLHASSATSATIFGLTNTSGTITYNMTGANLYLDSSVSSIYAFRNQAGTESMRIDSSGNLLINTTSQLTSGRLCIADDLRYYNPIVLKDTQTATYSGIGYILFNNASNATAGYITHNGSTSVGYTSASDYRLKENVTPFVDAISRVMQLKPCTYTWKEDGSHGEGFIAHELAEVCPIAVFGEKDAVKEDGSIIAQAIDTSFLVATLTAAIQEQQAIIAQQSLAITQLQADVAALKG